MKLTRRDFLASVAGAAGGILASRIPYQYLVGLEDIAAFRSVPEAERFVRSTCLLCPGGCGIEVRLLDGAPVKIRGNPLHPINRGGLCAVGQEGLHVLYHPDRIRSPLKRAGDRGGDQWVQISWEEALEELSTRLGQVVKAGNPEKIVFLDGRDRGLMHRLIGRFMGSMGSPNHIVDGPPSGLSAMMQLTQGTPQEPAYDLENADFILSFGAPLLEGWRSPVQGQRAYGLLRGAAGPRRRTFVQVDTRRSMTATRADRWVPVRPGQHGALALSMAYVIIRNGLHDESFLDRYTTGFRTWKEDDGTVHRGFREHVLDNYRPDRTAEQTGVPSEVVVEVAKAFAESGSAVAVVDHSATTYTNGLQNGLAVQALNALVGSIDRRAGALLTEDVPFSEWPEIEGAKDGSGAPKARIDGARDRYPFATNAVAALPHAILGQGLGVEALLLYHSNPCFSVPSPERFERALARIPFVVSFTPMPDDTSRFADLILPDHTYLERWQDAEGPTSFPYSVLGVTQPVVEPLYDTRHTGDVLLDVARRMGGAVAEAMPWKSFEQVVKESTRGVFEAGRGTILADEQVSADVRDMEMRGWWIPRHDSFGEFWDDFLAKGGWWDPAYVYGLWGRVLRTPTGRYEFHSQLLEERLREMAEKATPGGGEEGLRKALDAAGLRAERRMAFLPHHEDPVFDGFKGQRDLHLNIFRPIVPSTGLTADLPWVREILNPKVAWDLWIEIHPEDAEALELENGEWVEVASPLGRVGGRALIGHEAQKGVVNVPFGLGHKSAGRWGMQRGANPLALVPGELEPLAAIPMTLSTMVRIEKGKEGDAHA